MSLAGKLLTVMLFIALPLRVLGWDWQTKITLEVKDQPLSAVCDLLGKSYGINFSYSRDLVNLSRKITVTVHQQKLKKLLQDLLAPEGIVFARVGDVIVLTPAPHPARTFSGYVQDAASGEKLPGATIFSPTHQQGTITNEYGFFSFTTTDTAVIVVSYIGYATQKIIPANTNNDYLTIALTPTAKLKEVIINADEGATLQDQTQMSKVNISANTVNAQPKLLGETDLLRTLQSVPGVSGGMDGVAGLHVRGGSPDQNLILLDGSPIYNFSHFFGVFSLLNTDVIKNTDLYKGAFPARFGGRLSSVVDITLKDGDMKNFHGNAAIGLISAKFDLEGPIIKDKTSFVLSARRSYPDILYNSIMKLEDKGSSRLNLNAYFYDINAKVNHIFSPKDRLYLSFYKGEDNMDVKQEGNGIVADTANIISQFDRFKVGWGNTIGAIRWNHIYGPRLFSNISLNYSQYVFNTAMGYMYSLPAANEKAEQAGRYYSKMETAGLKADFDFRPQPRHSIRLGTAWTLNFFKPGVSSFVDKGSNVVPLDTVASGPVSTGLEMLVYGEDEWQLTPSLFANIGLHASGFLVSGRFYSSLQPRLGLRYMLPHNWAVKLSYTHMNQYIHLLSNNITSLPTDIWVPATERVGPMSSRQIAAGICKTSNEQKWEFSVESYYKSMHNMIEYTEPTGIFSTDVLNWDQRASIGKGWSYGGEFLAAKKKGSTTGWIGYTLAWSNRQFPDINNGKQYPYKYDRRHDIEVVVNQHISKNWDASASWRFTTGAPLTLPVSSYEGQGTGSPWDPVTSPTVPIDRYSGRYNYRTEVSHRLDISITWSKQKKHWSRSWSFSVFNVYNQMNSFYYYVKRDDVARQRYLSKLVILPMLPSISYAVKF
ncbi:carboxypeptidase-like regulatory domain-containing protein [Chitinophaga sp. Hz27]|uniref:TonB-dependent receptor n=1 Tax=Chitinophaga sp. Hz27 TaxID=3347169 RepID=UPI0035E06E80